MSKSIKKYLCLMLSIIVVLSFTACKSEKEEAAEGNNASISTGTANEETQPGESEETTPEASVTPEPTEEPVAEPSDEWSEKIPWGDLDGDGIEEYILLESGDFLGQNVVNGRITMYVNDEPVYQYTEELWITGVGDKAYLDLNGDGQEEIFVSFYPAVNSMPLAEWFVLEKTEDGWEMLEMYHEEGNMLSNAFPITVVMDKKDFGFSIRCEGWEGEIPFDVTAHYEQMKEELEIGNNAYEVFADGRYEVGDVVGEPLPWGIWEIKSGTYNGENCLIAQHGLGGPSGKYDYYGNVDVYFNYDANGKIEILDMEFKPEKTDADWIGQMGEEGVYFSSVYPTGNEVVISEFTADLTHDGCDDLIQVVGYSVEESPDAETVTSINSDGCYVKVFEGKSDGKYEETLIKNNIITTQDEIEELQVTDNILNKLPSKWEVKQLWNIENNVIERMRRVDWDKEKKLTYNPQSFNLNGINCVGDFPERNIRVYAYNDEDIKGRGIAVVTDRDIFYYDWCYCDERGICPEVFWNDMKNQLQFSCHIYSEVEKRADELHVLQKNYRQEFVEYTLTSDDYYELISDKVTFKYDSKDHNLLLEDESGRQYIIKDHIQEQIKGINYSSLSGFALGYRIYLWCDIGYETDLQVKYDKMPRLIFEVNLGDTGSGNKELKLIDVIDQSAFTNLTTSSMWEVYAQIAQEYYIRQKEVFENAIYQENYLNSLYFVADGSYLAESLKQIFIVHDLNEDGTEEFFIARLNDETNQYIIYDVFTWKDNRLYRLMDDIGYRNGTCNVQDDGFILSEYSGTAYDFGVDVLVLPKNGIELECIDAVFASQTHIQESYACEYYRAKGNISKKDAEKITKEKYEEILSQYQVAELPFIENTPDSLELLKVGNIK